MIEGFVLPDWARSMKKLVNAMGGSAFQTLHDFKQWEGPAVFTSQGYEQEVNMIGHYGSGKQIDSLSVFAETVVQDKVACFVRQHQGTACTKGDEERHVKFVKVGEGGDDIGTSVAWAFLFYLLPSPTSPLCRFLVSDG
jgi:hypothetical protein